MIEIGKTQLKFRKKIPLWFLCLCFSGCLVPDVHEGGTRERGGHDSELYGMFEQYSVHSTKAEIMVEIAILIIMPLFWFLFYTRDGENPIFQP